MRRDQLQAGGVDQRLEQREVFGPVAQQLGVPLHTEREGPLRHFDPFDEAVVAAADGDAACEASVSSAW